MTRGRHQLTIEEVAKKLQEMMPDIEGIQVRKGDSGSKYILLGDAAEGGTVWDEISQQMYEDPDLQDLSCRDFSQPAADYYEGYSNSDIPGVHPALSKACESLGLDIQWYDPGTLVAYYDNPVYSAEAKKAAVKYKVVSKKQVLNKKPGSQDSYGVGMSR